MDILIYGTTEMSYLVASRLHQQHNITLLHEPDELVEKFNNLDVRIIEGSGGTSPYWKKSRPTRQTFSLPAPPLMKRISLLAGRLKKLSTRKQSVL